MSYFVTASAVAATLGLVGRRRGVAGGISLSDLDRAVAKGLPYACLEAVARHYPAATRERVMRIVVPRTTQGRREAAGTLSRPESERLERVARLTTLAQQVWESEDDAQQFLTTPRPVLDVTWDGRLFGPAAGTVTIPRRSGCARPSAARVRRTT